MSLIRVPGSPYFHVVLIVNGQAVPEERKGRFAGPSEGV
jgi:hypothetical protein